MGVGNSKQRPHLVGCHFNFKYPGNWLKFVIIAEKIILSTVKLDDYTNIAIKKLEEKFELRFTGIWTVEILNFEKTCNSNMDEKNLLIYFYPTKEPGIFVEPLSCGVYFFIRSSLNGYDFEDLIY